MLLSRGNGDLRREEGWAWCLRASNVLREATDLVWTGGDCGPGAGGWAARAFGVSFDAAFMEVPRPGYGQETGSRPMSEDGAKMRWWPPEPRGFLASGEDCEVGSSTEARGLRRMVALEGLRCAVALCTVRSAWRGGLGAGAWKGTREGDVRRCDGVRVRSRECESDRGVARSALFDIHWLWLVPRARDTLFSLT
jgi:hypothetical protein